MSRLAIVVLLAAGCGKSPEECRTEAEALGKLLKETPHKMTAFFPQRDVAMVKRTDLTTTAESDGLVVVATPTTITFEGATFGGGADLRERLEAVRQRPTRRDLSRVYFQLDRATRWSTVVDLVNAAGAAGLKTVGFAFDTGERLTRPPRSAVDDKLDALESGDPATRAVELAKLAETLVEDCPALQREFGRVGGDSSEDKADVIIRGLAPALIECNCKVDMPGLRSIMWRIMAVEPNVKVLVFDPTAGDKLGLPGDATWEDASRQLSPGKAYQLAVQ